MIHLEVLSVSRRNSSQVNTIHLSYPVGKEKPLEEFKPGAEWEEIEVQVKQVDKPTIQVGNIRADAFITGGTFRLIVNKRELFGSIQVGDIIPMVTTRDPIV